MSLIQTLPTLGKITFKISHQFKIILISVQLKLAEKDMIVDIYSLLTSSVFFIIWCTVQLRIKINNI